MNYLKLLLLTLSLSFFQTVTGQHFEWAASAGNIDIRYQFSSVDLQNNIVVGGTGGVNWTHRDGGPELYNSTGIATPLQSQEATNVVACYAPDGTLVWHWQTDQRQMELHGIAHDENGTTVLLLFIRQHHSTGKWQSVNEAEKKDEEDGSPGYYLAYLDNEGQLKKQVRVFSGTNTTISIDHFIAYPNGGFLICGFANPGKLCSELPVVAGKAGGDFVLLLDKEGKPRWADVVSYARNTCCSYLTDRCTVSAAPDGTVYLGGTYISGGTFGGSKTILAPPDSDKTKQNEPYEAYIASYSPQGKLNWVKTSIQKAYLHSVAAGNMGVVVAVKLIQTDIFLGDKIDTSGGKSWVLAMLDKNGRTKWKTVSGTDRAHDIRFDFQNNIYVLGTYREVGKWNMQSIGTIGTDTLGGRFTEVFIAKFAPDGKYEWVKEAEIPITTSNEKLHFDMDHCGNMYVSGTLWFSFKAQLSLFDKAFVKGKIYGPAPFISRFKNTIPASLAKPKREEPAEVCILSPGPWKLRNYPNPFATSTMLEYTISYADAVSMQLYSSNGQLVKTIFQNKKQTPGKYTFPLTVDLPAGTYIATLKGTEAIATCKIVVVK